MPVQVSYPGVYVQENPSGARTVSGVSTASTAFVDFFARGPMNKAVQITNFRDFERIYGGLHRDSESSYGLLHSAAKSRCKLRLIAAVAIMAINAPRLASTMSLCASHTSPWVPR